MNIIRHDTVHLRAQSATVDNDDGRYVLEFLVEDGDQTLRVDIHDDVLGFWVEARNTIGRYAAEADSARLDAPRMVTTRTVSVEDAIDAGYALDDPKSPGYHERMTETVDMREPDGVRYLGDGKYGAASR